MLTEAVYNPGSEIPWHSHELASFCVLVDGSYTENIRRTSYRLDRFDVIFKPEGETHRNGYGEPGALSDPRDAALQSHFTRTFKQLHRRHPCYYRMKKA